MLSPLGLSKAERIHSRLVVESLFSSRNSSIAVYPLRIVWTIDESTEGTAPASVLVSVPKKRMHHAVNRNRMKRMVREAYRLNKQTLLSRLEGSGCHVDIAFICIADNVPTSSQVSKSVVKALARISDSI
jgi:ribonuclease P protein component